MRSFTLRFSILLLAVFTAVSTSTLRAQDKEGPSLAEATSAAFQNLKPMLDSKNWDGAIAILDDVIAKNKPDSYDAFVSHDTEAKIYFQGKENPLKAVGIWEAMLPVLEDHPNYLAPKDVIQHQQFLAQGYYMVALNLKAADPRQREFYDRSIGHMTKWIAATPKPRQEDRLFYTSLLYYKAVSNPDHPDLEYFKQARKQIEIAFNTEVRPREPFYQIYVVILQQLGETEMATRYLEHLVKVHPQSRDYWLQLMAAYNNMAGNSDKNPDKQKSYYARAILTVERAQALGFLNTPKDNYNLVTLYNQVNQFGKATELMYDGLKSGKIENDLKNWEVLAYFYLQVSREMQAISVLKEASQIPAYSEMGEIDKQIAEIYYGLDNTQEVFNYCKLAVAKGHLGAKAYATYQLLSFSAYSLGKFEDALQACDKAMSYKGAPVKDLARLKQGIKEAIASREAEKATAKAQAF
jgi:hypothetical protein